jgi:hypothetical protein
MDGNKLASRASGFRLPDAILFRKVKTVARAPECGNGEPERERLKPESSIL